MSETFNSANIEALEWRATEPYRRELAQREKGGVVLGSGRRGKPKRLAQMVSVRLDPHLLDKARDLAEHNEMTLSDVLREGLRRL